jgi:uncharacterized protein YndB with AHSA1/START domain
MAPDSVGPTPRASTIANVALSQKTREGKPMNQNDLTARVDVTIDAPRSKVWDGLVNPKILARYMMGAQVYSDWKEGSAISWKGEWKGKPFEDHGIVLEVQREHHLKYSHFSGSSSGSSSRHDVTIDLSGPDGAVRVVLVQDNNQTAAERESSEKNWTMMLSGLKEAVETSAKPK